VLRQPVEFTIASGGLLPANADSVQQRMARRISMAGRTELLEVAALRRGVASICRQGQQTVPGASDVPDYTLTLGKMEQALQGIAGRLATLEGHPAMTLTPASFRTEIDTVARIAVSTVGRSLADAVHDVQIVTRDKALTGGVRKHREQRLWVITGHALGLLAGVALWYLAFGLLPRSAGRMACGIADGWDALASRRNADGGSQSGLLRQDGPALRGVRRADHRAVRGGPRARSVRSCSA
jgi:hypothetical protein